MLDKEMKIDKKEVGRRIRKIRINKGYTLETFGKLFVLEKAMFNIGKKVVLFLIKIGYTISQK